MISNNKQFSTFIPESWNDSLKEKPHERDTRNMSNHLRFLFPFLFVSTVVQADGTMPDSNLENVQKITGINPHKRESKQEIDQSDKYGWVTYAREGVWKGFSVIGKTMGRIGYITFRLLPRTAYDNANKNARATPLNTSNRMLARLFVKKMYRRQFLNRVAYTKRQFPGIGDAEIHQMVYNQMGSKCFSKAKFVLMENEFPYETNFESHLLVWCNPFVGAREKLNIRELFQKILSILLLKVSFWGKIKIIWSIFFLENLPVSRSIISIRHFHVFVNGITLNKWIYIY